MAKILVVDDEIGIRERLSDILSGEGGAVSMAENAEVARKLVSTEAFDLILLDIWMPDADGVSLLKELKARHWLHCPVVMMYGHASEETAAEALKFGALACLEKPIALAKLVETVQHGLRVSERLRMLAPYRPAEPEDDETEAKEEEKEPLPVLEVPGTGVSIDFTKSLREVKDATERAYLKAVMKAEGNNMSAVAKRAGLLRTHLYRKIRSLGIPTPRQSEVQAEAEELETTAEASED